MPSRYQVYESGQANELLADRDDDPRPFTERDFFSRGRHRHQLPGTDLRPPRPGHQRELHRSGVGPRAVAAVEALTAPRWCAPATSPTTLGVAAVFKLRDIEASRTLAEGLAPAEEDAAGRLGAASWSRPPRKSRSTQLGSGYSSAEATVNGHYLVVLWVQSKTSTSTEEIEVLQQPLVTLSRFDMPIYQRINERKNFLEAHGEGTGRPGAGRRHRDGGGAGRGRRDGGARREPGRRRQELPQGTG